MFLLSEQIAYALNDPLHAYNKLPARSQSCALTIGNVLSLGQAIDIALCNNPRTRQSWALAKVAADNYGQAKSQYLPTINATASVQHTNVLSNLSGNYGDANQTAYGPNIALSYLLYDFGGRKASVALTREALEQARFNYDTTSQNIIFSVIKAYLDVFSATAELNADTQSEISSQEALKAATIKLNVGLVTPADQAQAKTAYAQAMLIRQTAENTVEINRGILASLLHIEPSTLPKLATLSIDVKTDPLTKGVKKYMDEALMHRPDHAATLANERSAEASLARAKTVNYPSVSISASQGYNGYITNDVPNSSNHISTVALALSVPVFTGFNNTYQVNAARHNLETAHEIRREVEGNIQLDVWTSYHNFETAKKNYLTTQILRTSAQQAEELALGRYKAGKVDILSLLDAQAKLADARRLYVQAQYNWLVTRSDLTRAIGGMNNITGKASE